MNQVLSVVLDENNPGGRTASVVVMDDQLSLAIGRSGQNARLAAKLTGWRVDIQGGTEAALWALEQINSTPDLLDVLKTAAPLIPRLASIMRTHETDHYPYTDEERRIIKTAVEAVREAIITRRDADRPAMRQARARRSAQEKADAERRQAQQVARATVPKAAYEQDLKDLDLSDKVYSHLLSSGVSNVGAVMERVALGDEALLMIEGVGVKALREIKDAVTASGWQYREAGEALEAEEAKPVLVEAAEAVIVGEGEGKPSAKEVAVLPVEAAATEEMIVSEAEEAEIALEAETALEVAEAVVADVSVETVEPLETEAGTTVTFAQSFVDVFEDDELLDEDDDRKDKRKKKKGRTVVFDDKTGETFVVRKRRRKDNAWEEFGDEF